MRGTVFLLYDSIEFRSQFRMLRSQIGGFTLVRTQIEDHPRVLLTVQTLTKPDTLPVAHTNGKLPSAGVIFKIKVFVLLLLSIISQKRGQQANAIGIFQFLPREPSPGSHHTVLRRCRVALFTGREICRPSANRWNPEPPPKH